MKKLFAVLLAISLLFCGCDAEKPKEQKEPVSGISNSEELGSIAEETPKEEKPSEVIPNPYTEETSETEPEEEITQNEENDELAYICEFLEDLEIDKNAEELVISGTGGTKHIELVENFVASAEKNEAAAVMGVMYGYTMPYYFELSYEPDGMIKYTEISKSLGSHTAEFSCVYENESFYCFTNENGESFSIPKINLFWDDRINFPRDKDYPDSAVTLEKAKETVKAVMLSKNGYAELTKDKETMLYGSYGSVITEDYSEYADEYYKKLEPRSHGVYKIDGKPYYLIYMYEGENFAEIAYYISAEDESLVFGVSMVDGSLRPLAYLAEPKIILKNG